MSITLEAVRRLIERNDVRISEHGYDELAEDGLTVTEILEGMVDATVVEGLPGLPERALGFGATV